LIDPQAALGLHPRHDPGNSPGHPSLAPCICPRPPHHL